MKFDEERGWLVFKSGRRVYVPEGIVGLRRDGEEWVLTEGWSNKLAEGKKDIRECYDREELVELAQYVWGQWQAFLKEMGVMAPPVLPRAAPEA